MRVMTPKIYVESLSAWDQLGQRLPADLFRLIPLRLASNPQRALGTDLLLLLHGMPPDYHSSLGASQIMANWLPPLLDHIVQC